MESSRFPGQPRDASCTLQRRQDQNRPSLKLANKVVAQQSDSSQRSSSSNAYPSENQDCREVEVDQEATDLLPPAPSGSGRTQRDALMCVTGRHCPDCGTEEDPSLSRSQESSMLCSSELPYHLERPITSAAPKQLVPNVQKPLTSNADLQAMIRNEKQRESELRPQSGYLDLQGRPHSPGSYITPQMRMIVISWLVEVSCEYRLQQETLYLAVALLDRFLCTTHAIPRNMLQLVAVTCVFVAAKQEEIVHPTVEELTDIAANCFKREDVLRMEVVLLDSLGWRIKTPTAYTFLHLFTQGLPECPREAAALASFIVELAQLDYSLLAYPPSVLSAAALGLAMAHCGAGSCLPKLALVTGYPLEELNGCTERLLELHQVSYVARSQDAFQPLVPICDKYAQDSWFGVSCLPPRGQAVASPGASPRDA